MKTFSQNLFSRTLVYCILSTVFLWLMTITLYGQEKITLQVKTFDTQLRPYRNIDVSINGNDFVSMGGKGATFADLTDRDFPIKTIRIKDEQLEAASWNYSKGTLEIIVRTKSYKLNDIIVRSPDNSPIINVKLNYSGRKSLALTTDSRGRIELPVGLDEKINATQFNASGYTVVSLNGSGTQYTLTLEVVKPIVKNEPTVATPAPQKASASKEYFQDFDLSKLDSIQSLTVFYAIFKNYQFRDLSPAVKQRIDAKFNQLVAELQDTTRHTKIPEFIIRINDTTRVTDDVANLLDQARVESRTLAKQRDEFNAKIKLINQKLAAGVENLDAETRARLLEDISLLEKILMENESQFYKNQNDYRQLINSLKEKFFDLENLDNRLSES